MSWWPQNLRHDESIGLAQRRYVCHIPTMWNDLCNTSYCARSLWWSIKMHLLHRAIDSRIFVSASLVQKILRPINSGHQLFQWGNESKYDKMIDRRMRSMIAFAMLSHRTTDPQMLLHFMDRRVFAIEMSIGFERVSPASYSGWIYR